MFKKKKIKCRICKNLLIIHPLYFIKDVCINCYNYIINVNNFRKLNLKDQNLMSYLLYEIDFVYFVLPHPFGNIIRSIDTKCQKITLKIELSQEQISYKRNRIVNITDNILLYTHIHILNKTYEHIFNEILFDIYYDIDSLFIQIFDTSENCFKTIEKYKEYFALNSNIRLFRLYDNGQNKSILQNYAKKFDECYPFSP